MPTRGRPTNWTPGWTTWRCAPVHRRAWRAAPAGSDATRPSASARWTTPLPLLAQLLALFARGQRLPLPFFPRTAWAWLDKDRNLGAARAAWVATPMRPYAEQADAFNRLAWRGLPDPLDALVGGLADFEAVSAAVLQPLRDHLDMDGA